MKFADRLHASIQRSKSPLVAGLDPNWDSIPTVFREEAARATVNEEDYIYLALSEFYKSSISALRGRIAAVKPNMAYFEQYGVGGLRALRSLISLCREAELPVILDAKRGDIGTTAAAYSAAYLGRVKVGELRPAWDVDAITVNPFLGLETIEPFFNDAKQHDKGIFVLVKTSNPGSGDFQSLVGAEQRSASEVLARWVADHASALRGDCGYSGAGAVIGVTYPAEAKRLRKLMDSAYLLLPGFGSQGGSAVDAVNGFDEHGGGAIINSSRTLMSGFSSLSISREAIESELASRADTLNAEIREALTRAPRNGHG